MLLLLVLLLLLEHTPTSGVMKATTARQTGVSVKRRCHRSWLLLLLYDRRVGVGLVLGVQLMGLLLLLLMLLVVVMDGGRPRMMLLLLLLLMVVVLGEVLVEGKVLRVRDRQWKRPRGRRRGNDFLGRWMGRREDNSSRSRREGC